MVVLPFHPSLDNPTPIDILLRKPRPRLFFPPLNPKEEIKNVFRGMSFVEFPTLHVWARDDWEKAVQEGTVAVVQPDPVPEGSGEKRKLNEGLPVSATNNDHLPATDSSTPSIENQQERSPIMETTRAVQHEIKKPKLSSGGAGLLALGDYESDSDDQIEEELGGDETIDGPDRNVEISEEDIRMMRVLGAAAAADME